ncbi:activator of basal transcription 1-like [Saccostrea echinata]|uniref:activator of basal transcription 1-like n=1 Tax=Saccostrea echinata TaxID=191078 RepID=UPI002A8085E1|nr:activator of basal transcription 1-like [Saccostrea echinata]
MEEKETHEDQTVEKKPKKKRKLQEPGVIYLSKIPALMNVKTIKDIFSQYGEIGKVLLQPNEKAPNTKKGRLFTEGWVEFLDKKIAKQVAANLNNTQIGGKKKSRWHEELWNIKYLHRFKWAHLNERLAYEKAVHKQRLRTEIAQVKRVANFHIQNAEKRQKQRAIEERKQRQGKSVGGDKEEGDYEIFQRETEEDTVTRKRKLDSVGETGKTGKRKKDDINKKSFFARTSLIKSIFSGGLNEDD